MPDKTLTNEQVAVRVTSGTTDTKDTVKVLYNDGKTALVKWPGGMTGGRVFDSYVSAWVTKYDLTEYFSHSTGKRVWDCNTKEGDGRLTKNRLKELVEKLGLDPSYIVEQPKKPKAKQEPQPLPKKKERRFKLEACSVQICFFIEGDTLPNDWDDRVAAAPLVAQVAETGMQVNGSYLLLEYDNTMDMREFLKGDREKILDTLES